MNVKAFRIPLLVVFLAHILFWAVIQLFFKDASWYLTVIDYFGATYGLVALIGGTAALVGAKKWGGLKSYVGKVILGIGVGLLFTEFGQLAFSFYNIVKHVELPYPSIADVGFFGAIPLYIFGAYFLMRTVNAGSLKRVFASPKGAAVLLIPLALSAVAYFVNFRDFSFTENGVLGTILDIADPVGHVFYLSFALIALTRIKGLYGGLFRRPIMLIIAAFMMQYVADQNFLYQSNNESWVSGQYGDILYLFAYVLMAWGVIQLCSVHVAIKKDGDA